ncbi:MAG: hypothetical protein G01um101417_111 [Parcubacteria group bacterium Gr01-1014_17]|nr:MAG: hypothetical protein G01um101417_111 [Parcubacteria group bacterium Gr01-1014_17]
MFVTVLYQTNKLFLFLLAMTEKRKRELDPALTVRAGCQTALSVCASNARVPQSRFIEKNIVFLPALLFLLINTVKKIIQLLN